MSIVLAFLVFSLVVIVHELGHFYAARKNGILVEEFAIGMGPKLFGVKPGETLFSLRLFPIGGSCRMRGDEPSDDMESKDERAYNNKPIWRRMTVILAGVVMNFILALVISVAFVLFNGFVEPVVYNVAEGTPAQSAGLAPNDRIVRANGTSIKIYEDFYFYMSMYADGSPIELDILRSGERVKLTVTPYLQGESYKLGFLPNGKAGAFMNMEGAGLERAGLLECVTVGYYQVFGYVKSTVAGLYQLVTRKADLGDMHGLIGIANVIGDNYEQTMENENITNKFSATFWMLMYIAAIISSNLAVMNLLPIPVMDGGRMVFLILEAVRGKPMNPEREGILQFASFILLMILAVIVMYNDIMKRI